MAQLLFFLKKYYFLFNLSSVAVLSASTAFVGSTAIRMNLETSLPDVKIKKTRASKRVRHIPFSSYSSLLEGNLFRDFIEEEEKSKDDVHVNPDDIKLMGTIAGPCSLAAATLKLKGEKQTKEYGCWGKIGDYRIIRIFRNKVLVKNVAGEIQTITVEEPGSKKGRKKGRKESKSSSNGKIVKKVISREEVNKMLKNPGAIYKGASFGPKTKNGKIIGYRIHRVRKSHLFYKLGARAGDIITRVNGQPFGNMSRMLKLWEEVKSASRVVIDLDRKKKPITVELVIKD